jgi:hypothetical protein
MFSDFVGTCSLHLQGRRVSPATAKCKQQPEYGILFASEDKGNIILRNVREFIPDYMASHTRRVLFTIYAAGTSNVIQTA